jgi:protein required for attachment to host cells
MSKHRITLLVLADGEHARFVSAGAEAHFQTYERLDSATAHLKSADLGPDRPGRTFESADVMRHAKEPRKDPHEAAKVRFAASVAAQINDTAASGAFDRLIVAASVRVLQEIRDNLEQPAVKLLLAELAKDLTNVPDYDLRAHFPNWPLVLSD